MLDCLFPLSRQDLARMEQVAENTLTKRISRGKSKLKPLIAEFLSLGEK